MRVPDGWNLYKISEILERVTDPVFPEPEKYYSEIGIRSHGKGLFHKEPVTGISLGSKRVFRIHPNCFVVNIVFAWEQAIAKTTNSEAWMIASHRFPMFQPKDNLCDIDYLVYFFKSPTGKFLLGLASPGGAGRNKTLGQNEFARLEILIPPTEEQQRIAQILSTWDKTIAKLEALIATKQKRKKALMELLLTGNKRFAGFGGEWKEYKLKTLADNNVKNSFIDGDWIESPYITDKGVRLIQTGNIAVGKFKDKSKRYISLESFSELKCTEVQIGDVLICRLAEPAGRACLVPNLGAEKMITSVDVTIIKTDSNKIIPYYLVQFFSMSHTLNIIESLCGGSTRSRVSRTNLGNIKIKLPPIAEQQKIAAVLFAADTEIETHQKQLASLKQQKKGLMQQLLTGKIRVKVDGHV